MIWSIDNHSKRLLGFNVFCLVRGGNSFARADHHLSQLPSTPAKSLVNAELGELPLCPCLHPGLCEQGSAAEQGMVEQEPDPNTRLGAEACTSGLCANTPLSSHLPILDRACLTI